MKYHWAPNSKSGICRIVSSNCNWNEDVSIFTHTEVNTDKFDLSKPSTTIHYVNFSMSFVVFTIMYWIKLYTLIGKQQKHAPRSGHFTCRT